ncbi:peptidyl-tRNA hydrolase [Desulfurispirillum indicum S5]|uniref:Peptidyl-tRNA hydrolase n=1 Tax=Desulfurispirillum indicum (strain ATCC BAA-1389 / DSM 22839 / S5) TaxID=653733 RepID=E6W5J7_DESIS|nr:aminoacyl-tRNA hydrolase [Desulfurispirillum indicum]ADU66028.1 peptidyl-tRNA hydrolase [Desulfurispirillum indicum S5]
MKLIVGLGNPGAQYRNHRHNIGFMVVERIAQKLGVPSFRQKFSGLLGEGTFAQQKILLLMPQTYMNLSGDSVSQVLGWHKLSPVDMIVIQDDLDMAYGRFKLKMGGSPGGHNGIADITRKCGTPQYIRAKCGIGKPEPPMSVNQHVLSSFSSEQIQSLDSFLNHAAEAVLHSAAHGLESAMNIYNGDALSI